MLDQSTSQLPITGQSVLQLPNIHEFPESYSSQVSPHSHPPVGPHSHPSVRTVPTVKFHLLTLFMYYSFKPYLSYGCISTCCLQALLASSSLMISLFFVCSLRLTHHGFRMNKKLEISRILFISHNIFFLFLIPFFRKKSCRYCR